MSVRFGFHNGVLQRSAVLRRSSAVTASAAFFSSPFSSSSLLNRWTAAYRRVASHQDAVAVILPIDSPTPQRHQVSAFLGDKLLGAAAAKVLFCNKGNRDYNWAWSDDNDGGVAIDAMDGMGDDDDENDDPSKQGSPHETPPLRRQQQQQQQVESFEKGTASILFGVAFSNRFLRQHASLIIPVHWELLQQLYYDPSDRVVGSAIEATVGFVYQQAQQWQQQESTTPTQAVDNDPVASADAAIEDLAAYLLHAAQKEMPLHNAKGQLLALGGTIVTTELPTSRPHWPRYGATVTWRSHTVHCTASRKTLAEELAARKMLALHDPASSSPAPLSSSVHKVRTDFSMDAKDDDDSSDDDDTSDDDDSNDKIKARSKLKDARRYDAPPQQQQPKPEWTPFTFANTDVSLRNKETRAEWWRRGIAKPKNAFRSVMLTPFVFPSYVHKIRSWSCQLWNDRVYLVVIALQQKRQRRRHLGNDDKDAADGDGTPAFLGTGETRTKARAAAAEQAAAFVQTLVDVRPE
jgi:hypothetical protein